MRQRGMQKQASLTKQKNVLPRGRTKTKVTNTRATGNLNKTNKQKKKARGNGAGKHKEVLQNKTNASGYRAGWIKSTK